MGVRLLGSESTHQLLDRARSGDELATEQLYERCLLPLQRWASGRLPRFARGVVDTDDLVQQTVLASLRTISGFEQRFSGAFLAYLRTGVLNRIRDVLRRNRREPERDVADSGLPAAEPSPVEEAIGREALASYERALEKLGPVEREAVIARIELRMPYTQVAVALGKPSPDAARMTVSRALVRLAREMALEP